MDCRTCEPTLIDLVHDELATDAAADARAHLAECASCRASFERLVAARKLADGLELERPPQAVSARLLQLAEARAVELRAQAAPKGAPPTLARRLLDFVARFAMGRQVGMATIMLLIVAVGLWSLPRMRHEPVAGGTIVDADEDEAAPSPGVEPADRLALKVDPRSRRIRSNDGQDELASAAVPAAPAAVTEPAPEPAAELARAAPAKGDDDPLARLDDLDDLLGDKLEGAGAASSATAAGPARGQRGAERGSQEGVLGRLAAADAPVAARAEAEASSSLRERKAAAPAPFPASDGFAEADVQAAEGAREAAVAQNATQQQTVQSRSKAKRSTQIDRQNAGSGTAQQAPVQAPAAPAPAPSSQADSLALNPYASKSGSKTEQAKTQSQASLLDSARSLARSRGCSAALTTYERVIAAAPGSADAGAALIDMALCKRSVGLEAEAQRLLERAAANPATAPRARTLMQTP